MLRGMLARCAHLGACASSAAEVMQLLLSLSPGLVCVQSSPAPKGSLLLLFLHTEYYFMHLIYWKAITECKVLRKYRKICLE